MEKLDNTHPGEVLLEEFMKPLEITAYRLSKDLGIPQTRISEILKGRRRVSAVGGSPVIPINEMSVQVVK